MKPHGYTRHGHACCGYAILGEKPMVIARCGGPGLCIDCMRDQSDFHAPASAPDRRVDARIGFDVFWNTYVSLIESGMIKPDTAKSIVGQAYRMVHDVTPWTVDELFDVIADLMEARYRAESHAATNPSTPDRGTADLG